MHANSQPVHHHGTSFIMVCQPLHSSSMLAGLTLSHFLCFKISLKKHLLYRFQNYLNLVIQPLFKPFGYHNDYFSLSWITL
jgi:hypothetical protein